MTTMSNSERIQQNEVEIKAHHLLVQQLFKCAAEQDEQPSSVSNPPSERPETIHHYPEPQCEGLRAPLSTQHLKPASPNNFSGDQMKGQVFLN
jgi:hypothetical protein